MSERRACMPTEGEILDTHQHQQQSHNGDKTPKEDPPTRAGNECHNREEGGGGNGNGKGKGKEETVVVRKKRTWTAEEDEKLKRAVEEHGSGNWMIIERCSGLGRTSKSCRLRWTNHLRPNLKKGSFTEAEERTVVMLHQKYGNKWSFIASKLPGRTDNEVKNFWHGRLRRCRKQYLEIYPPVNEKSPLNDLNSSGSHLQDHNYKSAATDYNSHMPQFSSVQLEQTQNPISCYSSQNPSSSTSLNQNQLLPLSQVPVSSPHVLLSSEQLKTKLCTAQMHLLTINTTQSYLPSNQQSKLSSEPSPISKFSFPQQGSSISATSSSVSSFKLQGSSLVSRVSSPFNTITKGSPTHSTGKHISLKQPTTSSSKLDTSTLLSQVSCNRKTSQVNIPITASPHSLLEMKVTNPMPSHSYFQVNTSMISSLTSSPICTSSKLELPVTSPRLELLTEMWLNSSLGLAKPYSLGSELPQSQLSSSRFNRASSSSPFAVIPELPSFQYRENALLPAQEVMTNLHEMDTENSGVQSSHIQEAPVKSGLLYPSLTEEDSLDKCPEENKVPAGMIFKKGKTIVNGSNESTYLQRTRREGFICERLESINSSGSQDLRKKLQRNRMSVKRSKTEGLRGKISRREGLLAEISKTGVLLVESAKKERLISKLLNESSKPDVVLSQNPKTENLQFGEISGIKDFVGDSLSIEDLLSEIYKEKDSRDKKSYEDALLAAANSTLSENKNLQATLFGETPSESVLFTSYEHDLDVLCSQTYQTNLLKPDGIDNKVNSVQVPLDRVLDRDVLPGSQGQELEVETIDAVFSHITSMNQFKFGNGGSDMDYVGPCDGDYLNKSLRSECPENLKKEFTEQIHMGYYWGERSNGEGSMAQHMILDDSNCGIGHYSFSNMPSSVCPDVESSGIIQSAGESHRTEDSLSRNLKRKAPEDTSWRKRSLGESLIERENGLQELTVNDSLPLTTESTTSNLLSSNAPCSSRITAEENEDINIQPEELSRLLEFIPTILPEWKDISYNT